jgi:hypothetical protein
MAAAAGVGLGAAAAAAAAAAARVELLKTRAREGIYEDAITCTSISIYLLCLAGCGEAKFPAPTSTQRSGVDREQYESLRNTSIAARANEKTYIGGSLSVDAAVACLPLILACFHEVDPFGEFMLPMSLHCLARYLSMSICHGTVRAKVAMCIQKSARSMQPPQTASDGSGNKNHATSIAEICRGTVTSVALLIATKVELRWRHRAQAQGRVFLQHSP